MKKALSLFLVLTFVFVMFASVNANAIILYDQEEVYVTIKLAADETTEAAKLIGNDTYYYNNGYECVKVTDKVEYQKAYGDNLKNLPVASSVVFVYTDYEIPTVKQANSYVAVSNNQTVTTYVYSERQYTVISVYVYHKLNQGDSQVANYTGAMEYIEFLV